MISDRLPYDMILELKFLYSEYVNVLKQLDARMQQLAKDVK